MKCKRLPTDADGFAFTAAGANNGASAITLRLHAARGLRVLVEDSLAMDCFHFSRCMLRPHMAITTWAGAAIGHRSECFLARPARRARVLVVKDSRVLGHVLCRVKFFVAPINRALVDRAFLFLHWASAFHACVCLATTALICYSVKQNFCYKIGKCSGSGSVSTLRALAVKPSHRKSHGNLP